MRTPLLRLSPSRRWAACALAVAGALIAPLALGKLPPLNDEAKAKAAEAGARAAHGNKVADFQLCKSMDKAVARYQATMKAAGTETKPATGTPPCADPGPFSAAPPPAAVAPPAAPPTAPPLKKP